jgi:hypothetical protein
MSMVDGSCRSFGRDEIPSSAQLFFRSGQSEGLMDGMAPALELLHSMHPTHCASSINQQWKPISGETEKCWAHELARS